MESIEQLAEVRQLLSACGLPASDISSSGSLLFFGCRIDAELAGVIGLEVYGPVALLRSLAVSPARRNHGMGGSLVAFAETQAVSLGIESLYLLTTNADAYFLKLGYTPVSREAVPLPIKTSAQFSGLCPASASCMRKRLSRRAS